MELRSYVHSMIQLLSNAAFMIHGNLLQATVQMGAIIFKALTLIAPIVQCNMLTISESILL